MKKKKMYTVGLNIWSPQVGQNCSRINRQKMVCKELNDNQASDPQQRHYKRSLFRIPVCIRSQMKSEPDEGA